MTTTEKSATNTAFRRILLACTCAAIFPACTSLKNVHVEADSLIAHSSVQVDVAPTSAAVQQVSVRQYFEPGNSVRSAAGATKIRFGPGLPATRTVPAPGGHGVTVLADIPGISDAPGDADPRRKTIPASGSGVASEMQISVTASGLTVTPLK